MDSAQRGIAFSTISAMEVSVLILIVGAETFPETGEKSDKPFSIEILANLIRSLCGEIGVIVFAVGFISAVDLLEALDASSKGESTKWPLLISNIDTPHGPRRGPKLKKSTHLFC